MATKNVQLTLRVEDISTNVANIVTTFQQVANEHSGPERMAKIASMVWGKHQITVYHGDECNRHTRLIGYVDGKPQPNKDFVELSNTATNTLTKFEIFETVH